MRIRLPGGEDPWALVRGYEPDLPGHVLEKPEQTLPSPIRLVARFSRSRRQDR